MSLALSLKISLQSEGLSATFLVPTRDSEHINRDSTAELIFLDSPSLLQAKDFFSPFPVVLPFADDCQWLGSCRRGFREVEEVLYLILRVVAPLLFQWSLLSQSINQSNRNYRSIAIGGDHSLSHLSDYFNIFSLNFGLELRERLLNICE